MDTTSELEEWKHLLDRFAIPLWGLDSEKVPRKLGTGTLIEFETRLLLLTAEHVTEADHLAWAVQMRYEERTGQTELYALGPLNYLLRVSAGSANWVDVAYAFVPETLEPRHQVIKDTGRVIHDDPRLVIVTDLTDSPIVGREYGLAGTTKFFITHEGKYLGGDVQVETGLTFLERRDELLVFTLGKTHPGHVEYEGTSGGPIADSEGTLVGLVISGDEKRSEICGIAFAAIRSALLAACLSAG